MENIFDFYYCGKFYFDSTKDNKRFFIVQALTYEENDKGFKSNILNIYTTEDIFTKLDNKKYMEKIKVKIIPNFNSGKIYYEVIA